MAGRRAKPTTTAPLMPSSSLVASAVRYPGKVPRIYHPSKNWQHEAWRMYDITPELQFAAGWIGNALSRVQLFPGEMIDGKVVPSEKSEIKDELDALFSGADGQAQMLHACGVHLTVAGECYLVGRQTPEGQVWEIVGTEEMKVQGDRWAINYGDMYEQIELTDSDVVIRIWRPHPARRIEATSPVRALLPTLKEIEWLTRHVFAQITSRLAGAGVWVLPQSVQFPAAPGEEASTNPADGIMKMLARMMLEPIQNPDSPAALVPGVITVPDDTVDKIKEALHFWTPLDNAVNDMRRTAVDRFAVGMDIPPEIILGMTSGASRSGGTGNGVSHWTSWQIEESAIKMHIEPLMELIVNAVTIAYLRPLTDMGHSVVGYDTTSLKLQPDRSKEALELFDRGELSPSALREFTGFSPSNAPSDDDVKQWIIRKIATGSATPEQVGGALKLLGVDLPLMPDQGSLAPPPPQTPQDPTLEGHPSRSVPDTKSALIPVAESLVLRALERAGNRIRAKGMKPPCPSYETHCYGTGSRGMDSAELLADAWTHVTTVTTGMDVDAAGLTKALDSYCSMLLMTAQRHDRKTMEKYLGLVPVAA